MTTTCGQETLHRPSISSETAKHLGPRSVQDPLARERRLREELERAHRAKDRFIAVLSHDLRAPLHAILGWTQLLRGGGLDHEGRARALEIIERNARVQAHMLDELLDVSRMTEARVQLALAPLDVGSIARHVVEGMSPRASELGVELSLVVEPHLVVIADGKRLEQVLMNLLSNALKYTPSGGAIVVEACRAGAHVRLHVRDTGKGIGPELLRHVFEMYTQERDYASARSGLGLGLYIVKQLVELHAGTVTAESDGDGRGATFTILLPSREGLSSVPSEPRLEAKGYSLSDVQVLVVDDDEDSRELTAAILRRAGAAVECASGSQSAMELFVRWAPDVVVSDLAMPGVDGCELVSALRAQDATIAAIALSGFTASVDAERARQAGFDAYVGKPVDVGELVEAVHEGARLRLARSP